MVQTRHFALQNGFCPRPKRFLPLKYTFGFNPFPAAENAT